MRTNREDIYIHPKAAIRLFNDSYRAFGTQVLTSSRFKVSREAWITSVFLYTLGRAEGREWFLRPNPKDEAPDFYCCTFTKETKGVVQYIREVEIFEWRKESDNDFIKSLHERKIKRLVVPKITLVCYVRKPGPFGPIKSLSEQINGLKPKVMDIWILASTLPDESRYIVSQLYPHLAAFNFDYNEVLGEKEKVSFVRGFRAGKADDIEFQPFGKVLLTPEFQFKIISGAEE